MAWVTSAEVASFLGKTFTVPQTAQATLLIEAAEAKIEEHTGRLYGTTSPVTAEDHWYLDGPLLWLNNRPVTAITAMTRRDGISDTTPTELVAGTDYELQDALTGRVYIPGWSAGDRYRISYTLPSTVPANVLLATKMLVGFWMRPLLEGVNSGVSSLSVAGDYSVTYQAVVAERGMPSEVLALLQRRLAFA